MINSYIKGVAHYVPEQVLTNDDLSKMMDTSDEWIKTRTGIHQRHTTGDTNLGPADLAVKASEILFDRYSIDRDSIDFVVFATSTPDYFVPGSGSIFQNKLGLKNVGVLDIRQGCSGFTYAITVADNFIKSGTHKNILVVGAEVQTTQLDFDDAGRGTAVLFGDGAAVCLVSATEKNKGVLSSHLHSDGRYIQELGTEYPSSKYKDIITGDDVKNRKHHIHMNGREVFKHAVRRFPEVITEGLEHNDLTMDDVSLVIPHQANYRITQAVQKSLNVPDHKIFSNIHKYGNTTAASIGIALSESLEQGLINDEDIVVLASFGAGFYWGSVIIKW
ncbi:MAG: 3-oxoacyl-ACP synthase [Candidatus Marinimicrobia bacterium]|nr:3-oxoacyl-ACP synthase [Candidatus Neomarinimicrobiota bacterium]|tara:strand:+ start:29883 stop:30878 length:996 start_codon:yes stop_codon:yes gene_type:complete